MAQVACQASNQMKSDVMKEQKKEAALRDALRRGSKTKIALEAQIEKLQTDVQKRRYDVQDLDSRLRILHWSSGRAISSYATATIKSDNHHHNRGQHHSHHLQQPQRVHSPSQVDFVASQDSLFSLSSSSRRESHTDSIVFAPLRPTTSSSVRRKQNPWLPR